MVSHCRSRAVFAGLATAAVWAVPAPAWAAPSFSAMIAPAAAGAVGAVAGAAVAGGCMWAYLRQDRAESAQRIAALEARLAEALQEPSVRGRHAAAPGMSRCTLAAVRAQREAVGSSAVGEGAGQGAEAAFASGKSDAAARPVEAAEVAAVFGNAGIAVSPAEASAAAFASGKSDAAASPVEAADPAAVFGNAGIAVSPAEASAAAFASGKSDAAASPAEAADPAAQTSWGDRLAVDDPGASGPLTSVTSPASASASRAEAFSAIAARLAEVTPAGPSDAAAKAGEKGSADVLAAASEVAAGLGATSADPATSASFSAVPGTRAHGKHRADGLHTAVELDYEDVASEYVERITFRQRMLTLSKGVAKVLQERLGTDMMEDLPVIQRADGSVGDVGTSWWEAAAEKNDLQISRDFGKSFEAVDDTAASYHKAVSASVSASFDMPFVYPGHVAQGGGSPMNTGDVRGGQKAAPAATSAKEAAGARRAADIARRVSPIDGELFPEEPAPAAYHRDAWEAALEALDERFDDNLVTGKGPGFVDLVGGPTTLDEPDGLERSTNFLGFRAPAGHPEVVDTGSYVNYLVQNEFDARGTAAGLQARRVLAMGA